MNPLNEVSNTAVMQSKKRKKLSPRMPKPQYGINSVSASLEKLSETYPELAKTAAGFGEIAPAAIPKAPAGFGEIAPAAIPKAPALGGSSMKPMTSPAASTMPDPMKGFKAPTPMTPAKPPIPAPTPAAGGAAAATPAPTTPLAGSVTTAKPAAGASPRFMEAVPAPKAPAASMTLPVGAGAASPAAEPPPSTDSGRAIRANLARIRDAYAAPKPAPKPTPGPPLKSMLTMPGETGRPAPKPAPAPAGPVDAIASTMRDTYNADRATKGLPPIGAGWAAKQPMSWEAGQESPAIGPATGAPAPKPARPNSYMVVGGQEGPGGGSVVLPKSPQDYGSPSAINMLGGPGPPPAATGAPAPAVPTPASKTPAPIAGTQMGSVAPAEPTPAPKPINPDHGDWMGGPAPKPINAAHGTWTGGPAAPPPIEKARTAAGISADRITGGKDTRKLPTPKPAPKPEPEPKPVGRFASQIARAQRAGNSKEVRRLQTMQSVAPNVAKQKAQRAARQQEMQAAIAQRGNKYPTLGNTPASQSEQWVKDLAGSGTRPDGQPFLPSTERDVREAIRAGRGDALRGLGKRAWAWGPTTASGEAPTYGSAVGQGFKRLGRVGEGIGGLAAGAAGTLGFGAYNKLPGDGQSFGGALAKDMTSQSQGLAGAGMQDLKDSLNPFNRVPDKANTGAFLANSRKERLDPFLDQAGAGYRKDTFQGANTAANLSETAGNVGIGAARAIPFAAPVRAGGAVAKIGKGLTAGLPVYGGIDAGMAYGDDSTQLQNLRIEQQGASDQIAADQLNSEITGNRDYTQGMEDFIQKTTGSSYRDLMKLRDQQPQGEASGGSPATPPAMVEPNAPAESSWLDKIKAFGGSMMDKYKATPPASEPWIKWPYTRPGPSASEAPAESSWLDKLKGFGGSMADKYKSLPTAAKWGIPAGAAGLGLTALALRNQFGRKDDEKEAAAWAVGDTPPKDANASLTKSTVANGGVTSYGTDALASMDDYMCSAAKNKQKKEAGLQAGMQAGLQAAVAPGLQKSVAAAKKPAKMKALPTLQAKQAELIEQCRQRGWSAERTGDYIYGVERILGAA